MENPEVTASSSNPHLPVRTAWLARHDEPILEPELPIIDPHHHLWDVTRPRYLLDDLLADIGDGHRVVATVFVECRSMWRAHGPESLRPIGETEFVAGVAAMSESGHYGPARACAGIVAHADLCLGAAVAEVLAAHEHAGGGRLRGIRHTSAFDPHPDVRSTMVLPPPGLLAQPAFRRGFAELARRGLSFDAWLYHTQLGELFDLAQAFPETPIVLDHVGGPLGAGPYARRRAQVAADWLAGIRALARCPNVHVKLGGLGMRVGGFDFHLRPRPPSSQELARAWWPWIEPCIEAFGPARCMFESNFPVDKASCSYRVLWNAFKFMSASYSADVRAELFAGSARRVYRLTV